MNEFNEVDKRYLKGQCQGILNEINNPEPSSIYMEEKLNKIAKTIEENINKPKMLIDKINGNN